MAVCEPKQRDSIMGDIDQPCGGTPNIAGRHLSSTEDRIRRPDHFRGWSGASHGHQSHPSCVPQVVVILSREGLSSGGAFAQTQI